MKREALFSQKPGNIPITTSFLDENKFKKQIDTPETPTQIMYEFQANLTYIYVRKSTEIIPDFYSCNMLAS